MAKIKKGHCGNNPNVVYYISYDNNIILCNCILNICYNIYEYVEYTLEEFLEKFPYKVEDRVIIKKYKQIFKILSARWCTERNIMIYQTSNGWYYTNELQPYEGDTIDITNKVIFDCNAQRCDIMNDIIKKDMKEIKIDIPAGYEFAGVDDDAQQVVFAKIGYHYPKTFVECCEITYPNENFQAVAQPIKGHNGKKLL